MNKIEEILRSKNKPKEKQVLLVKAVCNSEITGKEFIDFFTSASDVDKGTCADVMKHVSEQKPGLLAPFIDVLIGHINYKTLRVKWGVPEAIGNLARNYPEEVVEAIPKLFRNTKDDSTVVRWCAAYALTEIAKYNSRKQKELQLFFSKMVKQEKNKGVKNVYLKALKQFKE